MSSNRRRLPQQPLEHLRQRLGPLDPGQSDGEALALVDDVGGSVGVEVSGAALGLAAVDLVLAVQRLAVVGDQGQVAGQRLAPLLQALGQVGPQTAVEAALQLGIRGQGGQQGVVGGTVRGGVTQAGTGGGQRTDAAGGPEQDRPQNPDLALGAVVLEADVTLTQLSGVAVDSLAVDGILATTHGFLLG